MASPSQVPVRYPSGVSTDNPWGPLANYGQPNPFMYHTVYDDFDERVSAQARWTVYGSAGGTTVNSAAYGEGGVWQHTTGGLADDVMSIELTVPSFYIPPPVTVGNSISSKKVFFMTRLNVTTIATTSWTVGLINQSGAPLLQPTDGVYLQSTNATNMALYAYSASVLQWSVAIPPAVLALYYANATWIDVGFYIDRLLNVYAMVGYPLFGWQPASAWTGINNVNAQPTPKAAVASYLVSISGQWTPTTALLTPAQIIAGATGSVVATDFLIAAKER